MTSAKTQSTKGHLLRYETFVREGFSIFFDLVKACDTTWDE